MCECTTSSPAAPAAIARSTPSVCSEKFASASSGVGSYAVAPSRRRTEAGHVDLGQAAQLAYQEVDVHARPTVDVGGELSGHDSNVHATTLG